MSEQNLKHFVQALGSDIAMTGPRNFDLLYDEPGLLVRCTLAADDRTLVVDIYILDVAMFQGGVRRALIRALLAINDAAVRHSTYALSIDSRSFLVLTGRLPLTGETAAQDLVPERFNAHLSFWVEQAERLRELAQALSFEDGRFGYDLIPMKEEE